MILTGTGHDGKPTRRRFMIIASSGHGPYIPCMPAILLARRLAQGKLSQRGAAPCIDLIDLDTYLAATRGAGHHHYQGRRQCLRSQRMPSAIGMTQLCPISMIAGHCSCLTASAFSVPAGRAGSCDMTKRHRSLIAGWAVKPSVQRLSGDECPCRVMVLSAVGVSRRMMVSEAPAS